MINEEKMPWGSRMIRFQIKFFTNDLPDSSKVDKKTAWAKGVITLPKNEHRGIDHDIINFNNMEEFLPKLKHVIERNNIKLVKPRLKVEFEDIKT